MTEAARIEMPEAGYISTLVDILIYIETARYHPVPIADSTAYGVLPKNFKTTALYHQVSRNNRKNNMENKALVGLLAVLPLMTLVRFTHCLFSSFQSYSSNLLVCLVVYLFNLRVIMSMLDLYRVSTICHCFDLVC